MCYLQSRVGAFDLCLSRVSLAVSSRVVPLCSQLSMSHCNAEVWDLAQQIDATQKLQETTHRYRQADALQVAVQKTSGQ